MMAYTKKQISLSFVLGGNSPEAVSPTFADTGANKADIPPGLRISCHVAKTASPAINLCEIRVFGLPPTIYNQLTAIYNITQQAMRNTVIVKAGDETGMATVFIGQINIAQIDLNQQPDAVLNIIAQSALMQNLTPADPTPYPNSFNAAIALEDLADKMKMDFENNGVSVMVPRMTLTGPFSKQALQIAEAAKINLAFDDTTMVIFPKGGSRVLQPVVKMSAQDGMIGYPAFGTHGIGVRCLYNPSIKWGGKIQLASSLKTPNLNGNWTVYELSHTLESEMPDGKWETQFQAQNWEALAP